MGLFNFFKKKISVKDVNSNYLIALTKSGRNIKFGTTLEVSSNFVCAIVYKNKIADIFTEGRYRLDTNNMPLLTRMEKLTRQDRRGNLPKKFRADIYYINLKTFENIKFNSIDESVYIKDKNYKNIFATLSGKFSFQVTNIIDFMEALFCKYGVQKDANVKQEVSSWVAESVTKIVQRKKPTFEMLYTKDKKCFEDLIDLLNKELFDCGIKILDAQVDDVKFPKRIYQKITISQQNMFEPKQEEFRGEIFDLENPVKDAIEKDFENQSNEVYRKEAQDVENDMNTKVFVSNSEGFSEVKFKEEAMQANDDFDNDMEGIANSNVYSEVNVDLNELKDESESAVQLDNSQIQKTIEYKICPNCKSLNSKDAVTCFSCKHKFE